MSEDDPKNPNGKKPPSPEELHVERSQVSCRRCHWTFDHFVIEQIENLQQCRTYLGADAFDQSPRFFWETGVEQQQGCTQVDGAERLFEIVHDERSDAFTLLLKAAQMQALPT